MLRGPSGPNQLFETMKREGADKLENVAGPQGSDVTHLPDPVLRQKLDREQSSRSEIH